MQQPERLDFINYMAIKIQRAWRKHKTRRLIHNLLNPIPQIPLKTSNSLLERV